MLKVNLQKRGVLYKELSEYERDEVQRQFQKMFTVSDHQIEKYRFLKTEKFGWIIVNANNLPLRTKSMVI